VALLERRLESSGGAGVVDPAVAQVQHKSRLALSPYGGWHAHWCNHPNAAVAIITQERFKLAQLSFNAVAGATTARVVCALDLNQ
jgi:hypothetical protein